MNVRRRIEELEQYAGTPSRVRVCGQDRGAVG